MGIRNSSHLFYIQCLCNTFKQVGTYQVNFRLFSLEIRQTSSISHAYLVPRTYNHDENHLIGVVKLSLKNMKMYLPIGVTRQMKVASCPTRTDGFSALCPLQSISHRESSVIGLGLCLIPHSAISLLMFPLEPLVCATINYLGRHLLIGNQTNQVGRYVIMFSHL